MDRARDGALLRTLKGVLIGMADPVPGVSAGTMAYVTGLYDRAVMAIRRFRQGGWRGNLGFLLPIAGGMLLGIFLLASVIEALLGAFPNATRQAFTGLIVGGLWLIRQEEELRIDRRRTASIVLVAAALVALLALVPHRDPFLGEPIREPTTGQGVYIFGAGVVAAAGMVVPGLSGALLQIVIGSYATYVTAVRELNALVLLLFYIGAVVGIAGMAQALGALFERHHQLAHVVIGGLVLGSAVFVWPFDAGWTAQAIGLPLAVLAALLPVILARWHAGVRGR